MIQLLDGNQIPNSNIEHLTLEENGVVGNFQFDV